MVKPRFNLKNKKNASTSILLIFRAFGERFVYSAGHKINPKYWNDRTMRVRETQDFLEAGFINQELDKIEFIAKEIAKEYRSKDKTLSSIAFKNEMNSRYKNKNVSAEIHDFTSFMKKFISERSASPKYTKGSIKVYKTAKNHIQRYVNNKRISFEDLTIDFFLSFINYLFYKDFSDNYVNKLISTLRTMLNDATDRGINSNFQYKSRKISVPKRETDHIYLNMDELNKLVSIKLDHSPRLDRVRDLFLIGAFSGLRFSDFSFLKPHNIKNIDGVKVFEKATQKTKDKLIIPIHPFVEAILAKYNGELPKTISNHKLNKYLKELCALAEIDTNVIIRQYKGGKAYELSRSKYELVSSHTARRSFATNAYKAGVPMLGIMRITGHKKPETFMKYIKFSNEENAMLMAKHEFFSF